MPFYSICLSAETDGVARIIPARPRTWGLKVRCDNCREVSPRFIHVDEEEKQESGGGGTRNAAFKCSFCKGLLTISIDPNSYAAYTAGDSDGKVVSIEVRGGEPTEVLLDDQWILEGEASGAQFKNVDLSNDWMEYDEGSSTAMSVSDITAIFRKTKKTK